MSSLFDELQNLSSFQEPDPSWSSKKFDRWMVVNLAMKFKSFNRSYPCVIKKLLLLSKKGVDHEMIEHEIFYSLEDMYCVFLHDKIFTERIVKSLKLHPPSQDWWKYIEFYYL